MRRTSLLLPSAGVASDRDRVQPLRVVAPASEVDDGPEIPPLTWMTSVENGRPRVYCETCARTYLRAIEAKLDAEWW